MKKPEFKKGKKLAAILQKMYFPKGKELFFDTLYVLLFCIVLSAFLFGFHCPMTAATIDMPKKAKRITFP